jgi:2-keto-4-pentenoate hydratase/2-oxohepta-3-ene-1,7-dioic acid hydratase in catechol pathway
MLEGDFVRPLQGTFFENPLPTGEEVPLSTVRLLSPVLPSKVVCIGKNYMEHAREMGDDVPE